MNFVNYNSTIFINTYFLAKNMSEEKKEDIEGEEKEVEEEKERKEEEKVDDSDRKEKDKMPSLTDKIRENPWVVATLVLGIIVVILLVGGFSGKSSMTGATVGVADADEVQSKVLAFVNSQVDEPVEVVQTTMKNGLYEIVINYQGNEIPLYVTSDGENLVQGVTPFEQLMQAAEAQNNQETQPATVTKSDKPVVELFVMSHCPYGTQAEKGILPVFKLLGDKIDSSIKFVYYVMHGETEVYEQLNQYCIETEQPDKYYDYLTCFLGDGNGDACLTQAKVDKAKLKTCTDKVDTEFSVTANLEDTDSYLSGRYPLFNIHANLNTQYGIGGSPTLVINGVTVSSGRDSASYLTTICNAFNVAPEECNTEMSAESPAPGFGWAETAAADTAAQCA